MTRLGEKLPNGAILIAETKVREEEHGVESIARWER